MRSCLHNSTIKTTWLCQPYGRRVNLQPGASTFDANVSNSTLKPEILSGVIFVQELFLFFYKSFCTA